MAAMLAAEGLIQDVAAVGARFFHQVSLQANTIVCAADPNDAALHRLEDAPKQGADEAAAAVG